MSIDRLPVHISCGQRSPGERVALGEYLVKGGPVSLGSVRGNDSGVVLVGPALEAGPDRGPLTQAGQASAPPVVGMTGLAVLASAFAVVWPSRTGHAPSLDVLARLAELYECSVADLVTDGADFRTRDQAFGDPAGFDAARLAGLSSAGDAGAEASEELAALLEHADMGEIARLATEWSRQLGSPDERRALLLKLSAGLSLAVASPEFTGQASSEATTSAHSPASAGFEGIWHSRYVYRSARTEDELVDEHYLVARQSANKLIAQSLPHSTGSRVRIELALDPPVATGSWSETTAPDGYYRGATYHGALQLVIDPSRRRMSGR